MNGQEIYHYTTGQCFIKIVQEGCIKPATTGVPDGEKPGVWFTFSSDWEPTANKGLHNADGTISHLSREETEQHGGGLFRFVVHPNIAHHTWEKFLKKSRIDEAIAKSLKNIAEENGSNVKDWRIRFSAVPREYWLRVDVWHEGQWTPVPVEA
jgi:hypothetical protein